MIVPGFLVNRIYKKGSLLREEGGYFSFAFKNTMAKGTATLVAPDQVSVKSSVGSIELTTFPELYVDGEPVAKGDAMMVIGGQEIPHYNEEEAKKRVGEAISFAKGDDFITKIRGDIPDGKHEFKAVFRTTQFGEIVLNFTDYMGERPRISLWQKIILLLKSLFVRRKKASETESKADEVKTTSLYVLKDKKPSPDFGRLLTALKLNQPDRVPLIELNVDEEVKTAFLNRPITSMRDEVEFWLATGYDYVPLWLLNITPRNISIIDSHKTSYKQGLQERAWIIETEGVIKTKEDMDSIEWPEVDDSLFINFEEIRKYIPSEMKVIGCISAVFETATQAMGLQNFCLNLYDQPELIDALVEKVGTLISQCIERMLQYDCVGAIWVTDDLAYKQGPIIAPDMLRKYVFPWHKKYVEMIHDKGLPALLHTCGNPKTLFDDIIKARYDALHPLEANSVNIYDAKKEIGRKICLCGNVDLSYMLTRASEDEIREDVKRLIRTLAPGGGFCLGSSNSIPNYVPLEKYLAMNRACLEFGKYPISI